MYIDSSWTSFCRSGTVDAVGEGGLAGTATVVGRDGVICVAKSASWEKGCCIVDMSGGFGS